MLVIGLGIPGWLLFSMAEYYTDPSYPTPWREDQDHVATMVIVFWYVSHQRREELSWVRITTNQRRSRVFHSVMCIAGCSACCGCCGCGSGSTKSNKAALTTAPVQPAQRQDLEQAGGPEPLPNYKQSTGLEEIEPATNPEDPPSYPEAVRLKDLSRSE